MNSEIDAPNAETVLTHPVILWGAWLRIDSWYKHGELAPQPELSRWRLHPEAMLRELAESLRSNTWKPKRWWQVPYPKKGGRLRHYVMPTVRDQVAFMAHMVALGPILDKQTVPFAFGNRWYRPIAWNRRKVPARWEHRPYPVLTDKIYLPYARSHGLFRRVAHWTVARMTNAPLPATEESGRSQLPDDYGSEMLPKWIGQNWWANSSGTSRAFWAALDIELAYPSVRISQLTTALKQALRQPVDLSKLFDGCPAVVLEALSVEDIRVEVGHRLTKALGEVTVDPGEIPEDAWGPPRGHPLPVIIEPYEGIPTGLAISGMLLNVALADCDQIINRYLEQTSGGNRGAIVRFADDMYVLSRSSTGLLCLIEAVHGSLSGIDSASLATPSEESNICINFRKIKPDVIRELISGYLVAKGWLKCTKCNQPLPPAEKTSVDQRFSEWWASLSEHDNFASNREALERAAIEQGEVGPFVTGLVELLSEMGTDTLRQRFGEGARDHLARLHELARFDIEDEQVRPDTRRTFSVNRLVRAWLPRAQEAGEEHRELRRIRETIGFVLNWSPWKFAIWRAVVRGAARRPLSEPDQKGGTERIASEWLSNQLRRVACTTDLRDSAAWLNAWPEFDIDDGHADERSDGWKDLYLSFHRAAFWRALAEVIRDLARHAARTCNDDVDGWIPSPILWTSRAVPDGGHEKVAASISQIDEWVAVLYPEPGAKAVAAWPWELDELIGAMLAAHTTVELADAWRTTDGPGPELRVPTSTRLEQMPMTTQLLSMSGRLQQTGSKRSRKLDYWALANLSLGREDGELGDVLFPASARSRILRANNNPESVVAAGLSLGCFEWIGLAVANLAIPSNDRGVAAFERDGFFLHDYTRARRVIIGQHAILANQPTVHRLLWGTPESDALKNWRMAPWETPAVELPSRVAAAMITVVQSAKPPNGWEPSKGPLNWLIDDVADALAAGRRRQFAIGKEPNSVEQPLNVTRSTAWEVLPHAMFYRPFMSGPARGVHMESYVLYCDVLLLVTVLDGAERILDTLARWGVSGTPFVDRWAWRSRVHLPLETWESIEEILRWSESPKTDVTRSGFKLLDSLADWSCKDISWADFLPERIDVGLVTGGDLEIVRTIHPAGELLGADLPTELSITNTQLAENLVIRVGQVVEWPKKVDVVTRFPAIATSTANAMIEQVSNVFLAPAQSAGDVRPSLVVLPELAIPQQEVKSLRDLVRDEGKAALAGLYWRALQPAFRPSRRFTPKWACFVNEAELIMPIRDDHGPPSTRWFRVRKPLPAHIEDGLARALSNKPPKTKWRMLRGGRWYRFVHPEWGDFTVAICADLIDAGPWSALRGELLHLLMVAYNKDVEFFDSLTWVRAYENYVNVASVNHGQFGGSFIWTPRRKHERELARLRGVGLVLTADVQLPVKDLFRAQKKGVKKAIKQSARQWQEKTSASTNFKSPPPGFSRKL